MDSQIALILSLLGVTPKSTWEVVDRGRASMYRPWKKSSTVPYARYPHIRVKPTAKDLVCAHRTLPRWTVLKLTDRKGRSSYCVVLDRGPYGFCARRSKSGKYDRRCKSKLYRWVVKKTKTHRHGWYRGVIDATPAVYKLMRSKGWVHVTVRRLVSQKRGKHGKLRHVPRLK